MHQSLPRREFLERSGLGFGSIALGHLLANESVAETAPTLDPASTTLSHKLATAKQVIFLFMQGGPSHLETFDPKPELVKRDGELLPASYQGFDLAQINTADAKLMGCGVPFRRHGVPA